MFFIRNGIDLPFREYAAQHLNQLLPPPGGEPDNTLNRLFVRVQKINRSSQLDAGVMLLGLMLGVIRLSSLIMSARDLRFWDRLSRAYVPREEWV